MEGHFPGLEVGPFLIPIIDKPKVSYVQGAVVIFFVCRNEGDFQMLLL